MARKKTPKPTQSKDEDVLKVRRITDIADKFKRARVQSRLLKTVQESISSFQGAYSPRRTRMLEINSLYRNESFWNASKTQWQTKNFVPLFYDAIERKTSILHQALHGNRLYSPFSATGLTPEDDAFSDAAEAVLNNTMERIGFFDTSEECLRSTVKYGIGVYKYGWVSRQDEVLVREVVREKDGTVMRKNNKAIYRYVRKKVKTSQPFVRSIDVVDHVGWDPNAKSFDKWSCQYVYVIDEMSAEKVWDEESRGLFDKGSYINLTKSDPHGIQSMGLDFKDRELREKDQIEEAMDKKSSYPIVDWYGWFDMSEDENGLKEFIHAQIADGRIVLMAETNLLGEYPLIDVQYSKSLHSLTPWGVVDPVIQTQYEVNEFHNQRGDSIKLKVNPQFLVDVDKIIEDHVYTSEPGALHPFQMGGAEPVGNAMVPLQFQSLDLLSAAEEDRLNAIFSRITGVADLQQVLTSSNKNTPATTVVSILNEMQAANSMIVNGILSRHGKLGQRILRLIQMFGDEDFVIRTAGRKGIEFRKESLENILGEFDVKVSTSTFLGNRTIEFQQLSNLRQQYVQAPHIDIIEYDRSLIENILPRRVDKILKVPPEPISPLDEQTLFMSGQGESVQVNEQEPLRDLVEKVREHEEFRGTKSFSKLDGPSKIEFDIYVRKLNSRVEELRTVQQLQAQQAARTNGQATPPSPNGNLANTGSPAVRELGNTLQFPGQ